MISPGPWVVKLCAPYYDAEQGYFSSTSDIVSEVVYSLSWDSRRALMDLIEIKEAGGNWKALAQKWYTNLPDSERTVVLLKYKSRWAQTAPGDDSGVLVSDVPDVTDSSSIEVEVDVAADFPSNTPLTLEPIDPIAPSIDGVLIEMDGLGYIIETSGFGATNVIDSIISCLY